MGVHGGDKGGLAPVGVEVSVSAFVPDCPFCAEGIEEGVEEAPMRPASCVETDASDTDNNDAHGSEFSHWFCPMCERHLTLEHVSSTEMVWYAFAFPEVLSPNPVAAHCDRPTTKRLVCCRFIHWDGGRGRTKTIDNAWTIHVPDDAKLADKLFDRTVGDVGDCEVCICTIDWSEEGDPDWKTVFR